MALVVTESDVRKVLDMKAGLRLVEEDGLETLVTSSPEETVRESDILASATTAENQITLFESVDVAIEDGAVAAFVYERARAEGLGTEIDLQS